MADPRLIGDRYEVQGRLGSGGMGQVYEARDRVLDRRVAVKVLARGPAGSEFADRFLREARALARISHPNAVVVHDVALHEDVPYLVMELLEGVDLARLMSVRGALPPGLVRAVAFGMCAGLGAVHNVGMLHRDVKPSNVHLTREGRVVLQDFGIAHLLDTTQTSLTAPGVVIGTPLYLAPESLAGNRVGPHSDLYAVGACMYEMLTGRRAFDGDSTMSIIYRIVHDPAPTLRDVPGVPADLVVLVDRLLAKDPRDRPSSSEVRDLLDMPANAARLVAEAVTGELRDRAVRDFGPDTAPPAVAAVGETGVVRIVRDPAPPAEGDAEPGERRVTEVFAPDPATLLLRVLDPPPLPETELALSSGTLSHIRRGISPEVADARQREAVSLLLRGSLDEAVELLGMVADVCRTSFGPTHPTTLTCHYWQGVCLARLGAQGAAVAKFAEVTEAVAAALTAHESELP
ncbi:serine/threonine-protein kinase [Streptomyces sp. J2-1]|uniref:serine/threonine-protein kinase n=1 Tax=Streptomyces corallincola TaxID=2851888 RepID=UPI001C392086|nr:serine/threonine-protein kinase [Streptomyces corallincola]MBV2354477.1 serine/threonine-protein kinase [Streptomyces corallincola]